MKKENIGKLVDLVFKAVALAMAVAVVVTEHPEACLDRNGRSCCSGSDCSALADHLARRIKDQWKDINEHKQTISGRIDLKSVILHTVTYFLAGLIAANLFHYAGLFAIPSMAGFMRPYDGVWVMIGPLFQPLRGILFALALLSLAGKPVQSEIRLAGNLADCW